MIEELFSSVKRKFGKYFSGLFCFLLYPFRNTFLLFNPARKARKGIVNLNYWEDQVNLGDALSPVIVNWCLARKGMSLENRIKRCRHLYAIGSIITAGMQDCTIWGSGFLTPDKLNRLKGRKLDIRAVRGPLTRLILVDNGFSVPKVYGDPAIFLPELYQPIGIKRKARYGIVRHLSAGENINFPDSINIDIRTDDYRKFVDKLHEVEIVVSSSLHGIIIAESFGIRAILLRPKHDLFKYYDWYYSTRRFDFPIAASIQEAFMLPPPVLPDNLDLLRKGLLDAFPYDIFVDDKELS